jgi:hypothetical protein
MGQIAFKLLDLVKDKLPAGDVAIIRQVLQHLSNDQIARFVARASNYGFLVVTEHLPSRPDFRPNADKLAGNAGAKRHAVRSGRRRAWSVIGGRAQQRTGVYWPYLF